jgi:hypothetical protein
MQGGKAERAFSRGCVGPRLDSHPQGAERARRPMDRLRSLAGRADESASVNALVADREPIDAFATFHGFEEDAA